MQIKKRKSLVLDLLVLVLCLLITVSGFTPTLVRAETNEQIETTRAQKIIDNSMFLTFRKGDTSDKGKNIFSCFYVPEEMYDTSLIYGVILAPASYLEKYIKEGDYLREFTEQNANIANAVMTNKNLTAPQGRIFKVGVTNIPENRLDVDFFFIFYVTDLDGNTAYLGPEIGNYNGIFAENYSDEQLIEMLGQRLTMESSFKMIIEKLNELLDSLWIYIVLACGGVVAIWGVYIGVRIAVAKQKEERIVATGMVKQLVVGIIVMFVLAVAMPLLIKGLNAWL